jgi:hypothetical protein
MIESVGNGVNPAAEPVLHSAYPASVTIPNVSRIHRQKGDGAPCEGRPTAGPWPAARVALPDETLRLGDRPAMNDA